jgi:hypothetical protein
MSLAFVSVWILATAIPVTITARNGSAKIAAFLNGNQLPDSVVAATSRSLGVDPAYWTLDFVHLQVIPPWFALAFGIITTLVTLVASSQRTTPAHSTHSVVDSHSTSSPIEGKQTIAEKETV